MRLGHVDPMADLPHSLGRVRYAAGGGPVLVDVPWAGRYRLERGSTLVIDPAPGATEDMVAVYVTGFLLLFALNGAGALTLHGSAVDHDGGALLFCGGQGAGKSTLAAALARRGRPVLCDDVAAVVDGPLVLAGMPAPKLLPDAFERLVGDTAAATALFDGIDKYRADLGATDRPLPPKAVFVLEPGPASGTRHASATPIRGGAKLGAILNHVSAPEGIRTPDERFRLAAALLGGTPAWRLVRPPGVDTLDELVDLVERCLAGR